MDDTENPGECQSCGFETQALMLFQAQDTTIAGGGKVVRADFWYCELCAATNAGTIHRYPGHYPGGTREILATVCYVGNVLLKAIRDDRGTPK